MSPETYYFIYLFIYCLVQQRVYGTSHELTKLRNCWNIWHGLQQSAVDSTIDGEDVLVPAYGQKGDILSSDNMLIE